MKAVYRRDPDLLTRWHVIAPCTLAEAVTDTVEALRGCGDDFVLYGLQLPGVDGFVGMVGVEHESNYLVTFGLGREYRTPALVAELAGLINAILKNNTAAWSWLYSHNLPACDFIARLGFTAVADPVLHPKTNRPIILHSKTP
ncbi:hypothetical protein GCM10027594_33020 [Hymenobacter agri]